MTVTVQKNSSNLTTYSLRKEDFPVACPPEHQELWSSHPKVYLSLDEQKGEVQCPYCGTLYIVAQEKTVQN